MARLSNRKARAAKTFDKLDYEVYCRFKRGFGPWGGTADQVAAIKRVVQRERADDDAAELLIARVGLDVVVRSLQKLIRAKAFYKSTVFTTIFPDVRNWSSGSKMGLKAGEVTVPTSQVDGARSTLASNPTLKPTGSYVETSPLPKDFNPTGLEASVPAHRGRVNMSKSKRENRLDKVLRSSGSGITKPKAKAPRPRLPPNVPAVGNWNRGLLEPVKAENVPWLVCGPKIPHTKSGAHEAEATEINQLKQVSNDEGRNIAQEACQAIQQALSQKASFDACIQLQSRVSSGENIEPLALAQMISNCTRELTVLDDHVIYGAMERLKTKALAGAVNWMEEQKKELEEKRKAFEEQERRVMEWAEAVKRLISL